MTDPFPVTPPSAEESALLTAAGEYDRITNRWREYVKEQQ